MREVKRCNADSLIKKKNIQTFIIVKYWAQNKHLLMPIYVSVFETVLARTRNLRQTSQKPFYIDNRHLSVLAIGSRLQDMQVIVEGLLSNELWVVYKVT